MALVTSVVLTTSLIEDKNNINALNAWLKKNDYLSLIEYEHEMPGHGIDIRIYAIGLNYLDEDDFIGMFNSIYWKHPDDIVLILNIEGRYKRVYIWCPVYKKFQDTGTA